MVVAHGRILSMPTTQIRSSIAEQVQIVTLQAERRQDWRLWRMSIVQPQPM